MPDQTRPFVSNVAQDWEANQGRRRMQVLLVLFRVANWTNQRLPRSHPLRLLSAFIYRQISLCFYGIDLPQQTRVGPRLQIHHGFGLVVHGATNLGANVTLRHNTTLGERISGAGTPTVGDDVNIGAGALVLGGIRVGDRAFVGGGSVVVADVPADARVVGNPARVIGTARTLHEEDS